MVEAPTLDIEIQPLQLPESAVPVFESRLNAPQMQLKRALVRIVRRERGTLAVLGICSNPLERPLEERVQLTVDRHPLAGVLRVITLKNLARDEKRAARKACNCQGRHGHIPPKFNAANAQKPKQKSAGM
ncbi:MAG TPA: hypothetical protein VFR68_06065 [Candidatus Dormibacteraeota bacterium]|nr:hypothetical protein [Candidatus Dormibacteraeota bacterium]